MLFVVTKCERFFAVLFIRAMKFTRTEILKTGIYFSSCFVDFTPLLIETKTKRYVTESVVNELLQINQIAMKPSKKIESK